MIWPAMIGPVFSALPRPVHRPRVRVAGLHLWGADFACRRLRSLRPRRLLCGLLALMLFAGVTSQARGDAGLLEPVSYRSCSLLDREKVAMAANQIMEEALKVISAYQQARGEEWVIWGAVTARRDGRVPRFAGVRRFCTKRPGPGPGRKKRLFGRSGAEPLSAEPLFVRLCFSSSLWRMRPARASLLGCTRPPRAGPFWGVDVAKLGRGALHAAFRSAPPGHEAAPRPFFPCSLSGLRRSDFRTTRRCRRVLSCHVRNCPVQDSDKDGRLPKARLDIARARQVSSAARKPSHAKQRGHESGEDERRTRAELPSPLPPPLPPGPLPLPLSSEGDEAREPALDAGRGSARHQRSGKPFLPSRSHEPVCSVFCPVLTAVLEVRLPFRLPHCIQRFTVLWATWVLGWTIRWFTVEFVRVLGPGQARNHCAGRPVSLRVINNLSRHAL